MLFFMMNTDGNQGFDLFGSGGFKKFLNRVSDIGSVCADLIYCRSGKIASIGSDYTLAHAFVITVKNKGKMLAKNLIKLNFD